jgi:hypothetical protein
VVWQGPLSKATPKLNSHWGTVTLLARESRRMKSRPTPSTVWQGLVMTTLDGLEKVMSPSQIAEAQRRTKELQAEFAKSKGE